MQQIEFPKGILVQNLRELADKIESGAVEIQAGRFNVGEGFGLSVQPGWSVVMHMPGEEEKVNGIVQIQHGRDIEFSVQPSKKYSFAAAKVVLDAESNVPPTFVDENCKS